MADRLTQIETFVGIVEAGSLTAAARRLGVSVSVVSERLSALEARLGARLAQRSTRGLSVTPSGRDYYARCLRVLADIDDAEAGVTGGEGALSGTLRLAAPLSYGLRRLSSVLRAFSREHPDLHLDVELSDRRVDLVEEGFDLVVRIGELPDSTLVARRVFDVPHLVCASPGFWDRHGRPDAPADLTGASSLAYRSRTENGRWSFVGPDGTRGAVATRPRWVSNNGDLLLDAAIDGLGVLMEPAFLCGQAVADGVLEAVLADHRWAEMGGYVVYAPGRPLSARARRLIDRLVIELGGSKA